MIGIIIASVSVYIFFSFIVGTAWLEVFGVDICTPKEIYEKTKMNWFGCVIVYILFILTAFPIWILCFFEWLFHIGRKD